MSSESLQLASLSGSVGVCSATFIRIHPGAHSSEAFVMSARPLSNSVPVTPLTMSPTPSTTFWRVVTSGGAVSAAPAPGGPMTRPSPKARITTPETRRIPTSHPPVDSEREVPGPLPGPFAVFRHFGQFSLLLSPVHHSGYRGSRLLPHQAGGVGPQPVEVVVAPGLLQKDVDDEVAVVQQHPGSVPQPLGADGPGVALVLELFLDLLGDRAHLAHVSPAGDHEHLGDADDRADIEDERVRSVLGRRGPGGQDAATTGVFRGIPPRGAGTATGRDAKRRRERGPTPVLPKSPSSGRQSTGAVQSEGQARYSPRSTINCTAPGGTSPSSGQPRAARARRSVDETSSRGIDTRSQAQPTGSPSAGGPSPGGPSPARSTTTSVASPGSRSTPTHVLIEAATSAPTMRNRCRPGPLSASSVSYV